MGDDGGALSMGQKQRLLLVRAVYRQPAYLYLDEATSSLDASSERSITENLARELQGVTKVVIAHRLSTVDAAEQILVLERGRIVEAGAHEHLTARKKVSLPSA
ncbi:MAG TPA: ATP-binding cassette domain-containing protein [Burkholderiaceae bacterium]|nr:ATP-binding cassette domain-containing protein [Burkholderiaceae bacterium]